MSSPSSHSGSPAAHVGRDPEHEISLKVMRLGRPSVHWSLGTAREEGEVGRGAPQVQDDLEGFALDNGQLELQSAFGEIFLGETFSCFLSVKSVSAGDAVQQLKFKAELQTASKRYTLQEEQGEGHTVAAGDSVDFVLHRVIRDEGVHLLVCNASYLSSYGVVRNLRKLFKFSASQPFVLTQRLFPGLDGEMLVESELQNATPFTLCLTSLRMVVNESLFEDASDPLPTSYLRSGSTMQVLHRLCPKQRDPLPPDGSSLGYVEIGWTRQMCEKGLMVSPSLAYKAKDSRTLQATLVEGLPATLQAMQVVRLACRVRNLHPTQVFSPTVLLSNDPSSGVLLSGISGEQLPDLPPGASTELQLTYLPVRPGLQSLGGLVLVDTQKGAQFVFSFGSTLVKV